jgi:cell division septal protein FtsQ
VREGRGPLDARSKGRKRIPRRRFDVALDTPGAEIRLPAFPMVEDFWRVVSGVLMLVLFASLLVVMKASTFQVEAVEVKGLEAFTRPEITRAIDVQGKAVFLVSPALVKEDLEQTYPGLKEVDVRVQWPSSVLIEVKERHPALVWTWREEVHWIDAEGVSFQPHGEYEQILRVQSSLPLAELEKSVQVRELVQKALVFGEFVSEEKTVLYDDRYGFGWQDEQGWNVFFGSEVEKMELKNRIYQRVVDHLTQKGIRPALISVEYIDAPYYRMEY